MTELALQLIEENKITKDTFLDLGNCGLENELPEKLLDCIWLERLNLGGFYYEPKQNNWLQSKNNKKFNRFNGKDLAILQNLTQLQSLDLRDIKIQDYSFLQNLTQLTSLIIDDNPFETKYNL